MSPSIRTLGLVLVLTGALAARADTFPTVHYRLVEGSTYQEGCFDPCACPLLAEQGLHGTFDLVFYPFAGPIWTVGIENVAWDVPTLGKEITGQGLYRRAGDQQQLRLDLAIDDAPARAFDSGWVAGGDSYPFIDLTLSMHGLFCYDVALHVRAKVVPAMTHLEVDRTMLRWSSAEDASTYDVLCGNLTALRESGGAFGAAVDACLADDLPDTELSHEAVVGEALWFLVRPANGSYDSGGESQAGSRDDEIASSTVACP